ncbi:hypothetical protein BDA99DRAFT_537629 [Phascolomyces articulosus]|uniref:Uncharacterized protein n=1 Tax=Phascolomyces articulosus TaxID=60185 RepID=A0AAD5JZW6_9FUNG|nr:hypothetical protein BDA99DRAFT_537629 [Phascolomyces articulosus]
MGKFKARYDAFFDTDAVRRKKINTEKSRNNPVCLQSTKKLSAPINKGRPISIVKIQDQEVLFRTLEIQIRTYLETDVMKRIHRRHKPMYFEDQDKSVLNLELCLIEPYIPVKDRRERHIPHITGMEILETLPSGIHEKVKVISIDKIIRQVHVAPNYSTNKDKNGYYQQYLLNHDIDTYNWSENEGVLLDPDEDLIT